MDRVKLVALGQRFTRCDRTPLTRWSMLWVATSKHHGKNKTSQKRAFIQSDKHESSSLWVYALLSVVLLLSPRRESHDPAGEKTRPSTISMRVCWSNSYTTRIIQWYHLPFWRSQRRRMQSARSSCNTQSKPHHFVMICCAPSMK